MKLSEQVNLALHHASLGVDADVQLSDPLLDLGEAKNSLIRLASDNYTMAIDLLLLKVLPRYAKNKAAQKVLRDGINFLMDRLAACEPPLDKDAVLHRKSSGRLSVSEDLDKAARDRLNIVREIYETEKRYVQALEAMTNNYLVPLKLSEELSDDEYSMAFSSIDAILSLAKQFESAFEAKLQAWDPDSSTVGDCFIRHSPFFKMYIPFTTNFKKAQDMLATKNIAKYEEHAAAKNVPLFGSLLIMPVQRVPRYVLFLTELRKKTPANHPDAALTLDGLNKISIVAQQINERMRASEMDAKTLEIQASLWSATGSVPELVAPERKFIKEGPVAKLRPNGSLKRNFYLFCFNDICVYASRSPILRNRYHYHKSIEFFGAFPADDEARDLGAELTYGEAAFKITGSNGYRIFVVGSDAERREWLAALNNLVDEKAARRKSWGRLRGQPDLDEEGEE